LKTVGVIGAGQLGQMLGFAARALPAKCVFLDPSPNPPAAAAGEVIQRPFDDVQGLTQLSRQADVISYEFENVPVGALDAIPREVPIYPPRQALACSQDRLLEKQLFEELRIPVPAYRAIDSVADLENAAEQVGLPLVLKTRRLGYDGKGQTIVREKRDIRDAVEQLGTKMLIAEQWVAFDCEVSAIGARKCSGEVVTYALTENRHDGGILRESRAPAPLPGVSQVADRYLQDLLRRLDYVGVLALELFVSGEQLLANEFAPRVHNSGHWTIEGAATSQFENHLRAILGLPLGDTSMLGHAGMLNLIGNIPPGLSQDGLSGAQLHDYGKTPRPGRKLGHVTVLADTARQRDAALKSLQDAIAGA
jgi:5-(carboxyamino)imidazole ribonucleotide synthase